MIVIKHNNLALAIDDFLFTNNCWTYEDVRVNQYLVEFALKVHDFLDKHPFIKNLVFGNIIHIYLSAFESKLWIEIKHGDKRWEYQILDTDSVDHHIKKTFLDVFLEEVDNKYEQKWMSIAHWANYDTSTDKHETRGAAEAVARRLLREGNDLGKPRMTYIKRLT